MAWNKHQVNNTQYFDSDDGQHIFHDACCQESDMTPPICDQSHVTRVTSASEGASTYEHIKVFTTSLADADLETLNTQVPL